MQELTFGKLGEISVLGVCVCVCVCAHLEMHSHELIKK